MTTYDVKILYIHSKLFLRLFLYLCPRKKNMDFSVGTCWSTLTLSVTLFSVFHLMWISRCNQFSWLKVSLWFVPNLRYLGHCWKAHDGSSPLWSVVSSSVKFTNSTFIDLLCWMSTHFFDPPKSSEGHSVLVEPRGKGRFGQSPLFYIHFGSQLRRSLSFL